ncbi:tyrosine-type recombinase/integrase [Flavobacterium yafengii]|uniref:tyrosine-type recombinase/integrase n=1 Tax=Flavobacterium yafengii TaxID=3041253 RepID=UPI0024A8D2D9|nr:site-specific integrase [Flavobacterium yafengii]MDI5897020.1 site-specific integrase [Flavobacterium yafengii]
MRTITFELRGNTDIKTIQCRVESGRVNRVRCSTGIKVNSNNWDVAKERPLPKEAIDKKNISKLNEIEKLINNDTETTVLTTDWLKNIVDVVNGKIKADDKLLFLNACTEYIQSKEGKLAKNTLDSYNRVFALLTEFIGAKRPQIKDIDKTFMLEFEKWLSTIKKTSINTAIQHTRFIIIILNYCSNEKGLDVSSLRNYKEKPTKRDKREIVRLDRLELQKIKDLQDLPPHLENSRSWFLIGCEVGQRANDLLNITPSNISNNRLRLRQQKTGKDVVVPLFPDTLKLLDKFPRKIDIITLNRNIKTLCELAKINTPVLKKVNDVLKEVPKYKAVSTHTMRRSYASNQYSIIPTALIMSVTKHATESQLLKYIGLTDDEIADEYEKAINKIS